jgi:hypothetical protein
MRRFLAAGHATVRAVDDPNLCSHITSRQGEDIARIVMRDGGGTLRAGAVLSRRRKGSCSDEGTPILSCRTEPRSGRTPTQPPAIAHRWVILPDPRRHQLHLSDAARGTAPARCRASSRADRRRTRHSQGRSRDWPHPPLRGVAAAACTSCRVAASAPPPASDHHAEAGSCAARQ